MKIMRLMNMELLELRKMKKDKRFSYAQDMGIVCIRCKEKIISCKICDRDFADEYDLICQLENNLAHNTHFCGVCGSD